MIKKVLKLFMLNVNERRVLRNRNSIYYLSEWNQITNKITDICIDNIQITLFKIKKKIIIKSKIKTLYE